MTFLIYGHPSSNPHLRKLTPHNPQRKQVRMRISKEASRILFNPLHCKTTASILPIWSIQASGKWTCKTADTNFRLAVTYSN
jgi:hypothetical protein